MTSSRSSIATMTALALLCFASNSLLCRAALRSGLIDALTFGTIRVGSGAAILWASLKIYERQQAEAPYEEQGSLWSAVWLSIYVLCFSISYLRIDAGIGALILFGVVQATMIGANIRHETRPTRGEWAGLLVSLSGLIFLTIPGKSAPDPIGAALMAGAGLGWGKYSLRGRTVRSPIKVTARNFSYAFPIVGIASLLAIFHARVSPRGLGYAVASGAFTSGLGYAIWYSVIPSLGATRAAILQLAVPVMTVLGGAVLLGETLTARSMGAGLFILFGVALAIKTRSD